MRIVIFTGKGGVGKTSIAAATACRLAHDGGNVLIMSTDPAHSLGDSLEVHLGNEPENIFPGLSAMEIDTVIESRRQWGRLHDYLKQLIENNTGSDMEAEEALAFPGIEELLALLRILDFYDNDRYDVLVVDSASTGKTLSLLRFPEILDRLMEKLLGFVRLATMMIGPAISKATGVPKPEDKVFEEFQAMIRRLKTLQAILCDQAVTSLRIVATPERIVLDEARRNYTWMHLYNFNVDAVIINRIYPENALEGYFQGWADMQEESLKLAGESFSGLKIWQLKMQEDELRGRDALLAASEEMYGQDDILKVYLRKEIFRTERENDQDIFVIDLPFMDAKDISVQQQEEELILSVRNETRRFILPEKLRGKIIVSTSYKDGEYRILMK